MVRMWTVPQKLIRLSRIVIFDGGNAVKNALISVFKKDDGVRDFARALVALDFKIYASPGTCTHLAAAGIKAEPISILVGGDAILDHRVVTLSREIHAGLLARLDVEKDVEELKKLGIPLIHLVRVDFYPITEEIARPGSTRESVIKSTDIGGPTLIRAAVKGGRIPVCRRSNEQPVIEWLRNGGTDLNFLRNLAASAELDVAAYVQISGDYLLRTAGRHRVVYG